MASEDHADDEMGIKPHDTTLASESEGTNKEASSSDEEWSHQSDLEEAYYTDSKSPRRSRVIALVLGLLTLVGLCVGVFVFLDKKNMSLRSREAIHPNFLGTVNASMLAVHDNPDDCWLLLHGNVYDLTEYAPTHPGGSEWVTDWCGRNGTRAYAVEHATSLLAETVPETRLGVFQEEAEPVEQEEETVTEPINTETETDINTQPETTDESSISTPEDQGTPSTPLTVTEPPTTAPTELMCYAQTYDLATVQLHADIDDCWYVLYGQVYDFTEYVDIHPGGARRIFQECGTDATVAYAEEKKHDEALLVKEGMSQYLIGALGVSTGLQVVPCGGGNANNNDVEVQTTPGPTPAPSTMIPTLSPTPQPTEPVLCAIQTFDLTTVALHADVDDCWYVLYGEVYDLTDYIDIHPGGARYVFQECGTDATLAYVEEKKHDEALLVKEGMSAYVIGRLGAETRQDMFPCF